MEPPKNEASTSSSPPPSPTPLRPLPPHLRPTPGLPLRDARLLDLPDDLLLLIMAPLDPLPDLFSLRRTCRRLAELGTAPELSLLVVVDGGVGGGGTGEQPPLLPFPRRHRARSCYPTLAEAVAEARPGDTVRVSPTKGSDLISFHELSGPVHVSSPLLIRGCGREPEDTVVRLGSFSASKDARKDCDSFSFETAAALRFSASAAVLENLTVVASVAASVHHSRGALLISKCCLVSYCSGAALPHLHAPLATSAVGLESGSGSEGGRGARSVLRVEETRVSRRRSGGGRSGALGGGAAVRALGSGSLSSVRVLPLPCGGALLWCEVDADKGVDAAAKVAEEEGKEEGEEGFVDALPTAAEVRAAAAAAANAKAKAAAAALAPAPPPGLLLPLS